MICKYEQMNMIRKGNYPAEKHTVETKDGIYSTYSAYIFTQYCHLLFIYQTQRKNAREIFCLLWIVNLITNTLQLPHS